MTYSLVGADKATQQVGGAGSMQRGVHGRGHDSPLATLGCLLGCLLVVVRRRQRASRQLAPIQTA